jgi:hypothetical protein
MAGLAGIPNVLLAGSLTGTVVDRSTSEPIAGAIVTVHVLLPDSIAYPDTSGAGGEYAIDGIVTGNEIYVIMAGASGYKPYYFRYDEIGTGSYVFNIVLEADTVSPGGGGGGGDSSEVTGQVFGRDRATGALAPLPGAEVRLVSGQKEKALMTGAQGWFGAMLQQGSYGVTVSAAGYGTESSGGISVGTGGLTYGGILVSSVTDARDEQRIPGAFRLIGAYPNPFNPETHVRFNLADQVPVRLTVHNILGQELATILDATLPAGTHSAPFQAAGMASGVYMLRLQAGRDVAVTRVMLMR